jgi:hypothetical protein
VITNTSPARRILPVIALLGALTGCATSATPDDASLPEFCDAVYEHPEDVDPASWEGVAAQSERLAATGTPEGSPAEAREGFALETEAYTTAGSFEEVQALEQEWSDDEYRTVERWRYWVAASCSAREVLDADVMDEAEHVER